MLTNVGFSLKIDNDYGPETTKIVSNFQKTYYITISGNVDTNTLNILKIVNNYVEKDGFDSNYYSNRYPDLKQAFGDSKKDLIAHYYFFGKKEGRSYKPTIKKDGIITADSLNIRKGPGLNYAQISKYPALPQKTKLKIYDKVKDN